MLQLMAHLTSHHERSTKTQVEFSTAFFLLGHFLATAVQCWEKPAGDGPRQDINGALQQSEGLTEPCFIVTLPWRTRENLQCLLAE